MHSELKLHLLYLENISNYFTIDDLKKMDFKDLIFMYDFSVGCNTIAVSDTANIVI